MKFYLKFNSIDLLKLLELELQNISHIYPNGRFWIANEKKLRKLENK